MTNDLPPFDPIDEGAPVMMPVTKQVITTTDRVPRAALDNLRVGYDGDLALITAEDPSTGIIYVLNQIMVAND